MLEALLERILPPDHDPGAAELGVIAHFRARMAADPLFASQVQTALDRLPEGFDRMTSAEQDLALEGLDLAWLAKAAWEGALANNPAGLRMVGFFERV